MNSSDHFERAAGASDPGQRMHNEDAFLVDDASGLYIVADGVGGREAGEVAAQLACTVIARRNAQGDSLPSAIAEAHHAIRAAARDPETSGREGMASTVVILRLSGAGFELAWSGDSRAYFWDGRLLHLLTRDHSLLESLIERGELSRRDAETHPQKNFIMSALGAEAQAPAVDSVTAENPGSGSFLLCTDGLSDVLSSATLCELLAQPGSAGDRCKALTDAARDRGGQDNITALVIAVHSPGSIDALPPVYHRFDPETEEMSWPLDGTRTRTPTVRRLRPRSADTDTDTDTDTASGEYSDTNDNARASADAAPGPRQRLSPRRQWIILALLLSLAGFAAWQRLYTMSP